MSVRRLLVFLTGFFLSAGAWAATPILKVGNVSGQAGTTVSLPISFDPGKASISGIQFDLALPPAVSTVSVTAGGNLTSPNNTKSVSTSLTGHTWKFIVFGLNQTGIGNGTLLTAQVRIAPGTAAGKLRVPVSGIVYSDLKGQSIPPGAVTAGQIKVETSGTK